MNTRSHACRASASQYSVGGDGGAHASRGSCGCIQNGVQFPYILGNILMQGAGIHMGIAPNYRRCVEAEA